MITDPTSPAAFTPRPRAACPALDALLGFSWSVGDKGSIELWDYMGTERSIAQAARTSYKSEGKTAEEDRRLVRRLLADRHTSPFEMAELKVKVKCPIYVARQWVRHRMASMNEVSGRYTELSDEFECIGPSNWRLQSKTNKQGSEGALSAEDLCAEFSASQEQLHADAYTVYQARIVAGIAKEQARVDLPLSTYTEFVWKIDLHNLLHFLGLRMDAHAQKEMRDFANVLGEIVKRWMPDVWQAFVDFRLEAVTLSRVEIEMLRKLLNGAVLMDARKIETEHKAEFIGWVSQNNNGTAMLKPHSERAHFESFCRSVGISVPW